MLTVKINEPVGSKILDTTLQRFSNPLEVKNYIMENFKILNEFNSYRATSAVHIKRPDSWRGGVFLEDSLNYLEFGNNAQIERIKKEEETLFTTTPKESFFMDMEGFAYDMGSVVSGEPEYCVNAKMLEPSKDITVTFSLSANGGVDEENIQMLAISVLKFAHHLMDNNYIVNLKYVSTTEDIYPYKRSVSIIDIPLEYAGIANVAGLCSADFFRNIMFLVIDLSTNSPTCNGQCRSSPFGDYTKYMQLLNYEITADSCFDIPNFYGAHELECFDHQKEFDDWVFKRFEDWKRRQGEKE